MYRLVQIQSFWVDRKGGINFQECFNLKLKQILSLNYFVETIVSEPSVFRIAEYNSV